MRVNTLTEFYKILIYIELSKNNPGTKKPIKIGKIKIRKKHKLKQMKKLWIPNNDNRQYRLSPRE